MLAKPVDFCKSGGKLLEDRFNQLMTPGPKAIEGAQAGDIQKATKIPEQKIPMQFSMESFLRPNSKEGFANKGAEHSSPVKRRAPRRPAGG